MNPVLALLLSGLLSAGGLLLAAPGCSSESPAAAPGDASVPSARQPDPLPANPVPVPADDPPPDPAPGPAPQDPPPKPAETPAPKEPAPAPPEPKEEGPAAPGPAPAAETTTPEARALLALAAKRQGTDGLVGEKAPDRFRVYFATVVLHTERGDKVEVSDTNEAFALPAPGKKESRLRSEWVVEHKRVLLGHDGRSGWMKDGDEPVRRFVNRERDAQDIRDLESRRTMMRLGLRSFFLGNLANGKPAVTRLPDQELVFPKGDRGETRKLKCSLLRRAPDPDAGEPALVIFLDAKDQEAVAVKLLPAREGDPAFLLTLDYDPPEIRAKRVYPKGVRVPDWIEMFEVAADPATPPALRIQAGLSGLYIDADMVPDSLFAVPK